MSKTRSIAETSEFVDEEAASTTRSQEAKDSINYMADADRLLAFQVIAALAETGIELVEAGIRLADEYRATGKNKESRALSRFFGALASADKEIDLISVCKESFGKTFVSLEESLILSRLPYSPAPISTLREAAAVIAHKIDVASNSFRKRVN